MNDVLGSLQIYNAAAQSLNAVFNVAATKLDGSTIDLGQTTVYAERSDRLIWTATEGQDPVNLPEINIITLTAV
jgi:hypothetical protein